MSVPGQMMQPPAGPPQGQPTAPPPQGGPAPPPGAPPAANGQRPAPQDRATEMLSQVKPEVRALVLECSAVVDDHGEEIIDEVMKGAKSVAIGLSQAAFALISGKALELEQEASKATGVRAKINLADLIGDGGPAELVLARLFGTAEQMGVEGADDVSEYVTAGDALDVLLEIAKGNREGGGEEQDPNEVEGGAEDEGELPESEGAWRQGP